MRFRAPDCVSPYMQISEYLGKTHLACRLHHFQENRRLRALAAANGGTTAEPTTTSAEPSVVAEPMATTAPSVLRASNRNNLRPADEANVQNTTRPRKRRRLVPRTETATSLNQQHPSLYHAPVPSSGAELHSEPGPRRTSCGLDCCTNHCSEPIQSAAPMPHSENEIPAESSSSQRYVSFRQTNGQQLPSLSTIIPLSSYPVSTEAEQRPNFTPSTNLDRNAKDAHLAAVHALADMAIDRRVHRPAFLPAMPASQHDRTPACKAAMQTTNRDRDRASMATLPTPPYPSPSSEVTTPSRARHSYDFNNCAIPRDSVSGPSHYGGNINVYNSNSFSHDQHYYYGIDRAADCHRKSDDRNSTARMSIASVMNGDPDNDPRRGSRPQVVCTDSPSGPSHASMRPARRQRRS